MRVPVTDLVGHPGETRALARVVPPDAFGDEPWGPTVTTLLDDVTLDLHLDSVVEGILVRGRLTFEVELPCARCLEPQRRRVEAVVAELFTDPARRGPEDEDDPGYELVDNRTAIELSTLVRDSLVVDLPVRVLCSPTCSGLCPTCGADRNRGDCGHRPDAFSDPRWAKLADLDLGHEDQRPTRPTDLP